MSEYEKKLVLSVIEEVYWQYGGTLNKNECFAECWLAYIEVRNIIPVWANCFWKEVATVMVEYVQKMKDCRNDRCKLEARLSMNQKVFGCDQEIGSILFPVQGDFTKGIDLWDYAERLGTDKHCIMRYMSQGEDDLYIMNKLGMSEEYYYSIKDELRIDMDNYIKM